MPDPRSSSSPASPRSIFESSLPRINRIVTSATRRLCLAHDEAEDFRSWVHLRLLEDDYAILRKFSGRSSLPTYLTAVIQNLARDYRIKNWGRWRPSARAEKLGINAVRLETLLLRDGFSLDEAIESLRSNHNVRLSQLELVELAGELPRRARARVEGEPSLATVPATARADDRAAETEDRSLLARAATVVNRALTVLESIDRLVLEMHYRSGLPLTAVARALGLPQRELYTRRDRCVRRLRASLEEEGLEGAPLLAALARRPEDLDLDFSTESTGAGEIAPSNVVEPDPEEDP